jgi:Immunity protein 8
MRAEVRDIEANDLPGWPTCQATDPGEGLAWFTVSVGAVGTPGSDLFQVAVGTPGGVAGRRDRDSFVGLVVDRFDPQAIERAIRDFVGSAEGPTWEAIAVRLGRVMRWEYAGYRG